jgi:hypothetical protein
MFHVGAGQRVAVTFPGQEPVEIEALTDGQIAISSSSGKSGRWLPTLEHAFGRVRQLRRDAEKRPDADNLLGIYAALADQEKDAVVAQFAGRQFSEFKTALTELAVAKLGPIGAEMQHEWRALSTSSDLTVRCVAWAATTRCLAARVTT